MTGIGTSMIVNAECERDAFCLHSRHTLIPIYEYDVTDDNNLSGSL